MTCDAAVRSSQHPGNCSHSSPDGACSSFDFHTNIAYVLDGDMFSATIPTAFQVTRKFLEGSGEEGKGMRMFFHNRYTVAGSR